MMALPRTSENRFRAPRKPFHSYCKLSETCMASELRIYVNGKAHEMMYYLLGHFTLGIFH